MKVAALFSRESSTSAHTVASMLEAQRLRPWHTAESLASAPGAAGFVSTSDQSGNISLARKAANGNWLVVTGVPLQLGGSLDQTLEQCVALPLADAVARLQQLEGAFAALFWDQASRRLAIVTDILGMQPLHVCHTARMFAVATDVKAIAAAGVAELGMDAASWGSFLSMKHPIAGRTLLEGVRRAAPGAALIFDPATHELTATQYWQWPELAYRRLGDVPAREIVDVFLAEIEAYLQHQDSAHLCLSGGYDSRLILAALAEMHRVPTTMSLSHADELFDMDGRIASRMATIFGAPFQLHESDRSFYSSQGYIDYLMASEVATPSLYLFIAQLCSTLKPSMRAVWEGVFPGCILYPVHQPRGNFDAYLRRECAPLDSVSWKAAERVFDAGFVQQMRTEFSSCLQQEREKYSDDAFGVSQFVVRNRTRHRIAINPLQVYSNDVIPFTPGISKRFWTLSAGIDFDVRAEHRLYRHIFERFFPRAMKAPAISGTTPYALNSKLDADYWLARLGLVADRRPKVAALLRVAGYSIDPNYWQPSRLVDEALEQFEERHPVLSESGVRAIRDARPPYDGVTSRARELLFYFSWWRRIHAGSLRPREQAVG